MAKLFLLGIKHSGKTTQARLASEMLSMESVDSDDLVLSYLSIPSIRDYYKEKGKSAFMKAEKEAVEKYISSHDDFMMSLGGGASDNDELIKLIRENGVLVYLWRDEAAMLPVILKHGIPPFLDPERLEESFHELYQRRDRIYRDIADITIDLGPYRDKKETAHDLVSALEEKGYVQHIR